MTYARVTGVLSIVAAVVAAHDVSGPAFGGDVGDDRDTPGIQVAVRLRRPTPGTLATEIGAVGIRIADHGNRKDRRITVRWQQCERLRRGRDGWSFNRLSFVSINWSM